MNDVTSWLCLAFVLYWFVVMTACARPGRAFPPSVASTLLAVLAALLGAIFLGLDSWLKVGLFFGVCVVVFETGSVRGSCRPARNRPPSVPPSPDR